MSRLNNSNSNFENESEEPLEELSTTHFSSSLKSDLISYENCISSLKNSNASISVTQITLEPLEKTSKTHLSSIWTVATTYNELLSYKESEIRIIGLLSLSSLCFLALSTAFLLIVIKIYGQYWDPILVEILPEKCKKIFVRFCLQNCFFHSAWISHFIKHFDLPNWTLIDFQYHEKQYFSFARFGKIASQKI